MNDTPTAVFINNLRGRERVEAEQTLLANAMDRLRDHRRFRHYKGGIYEVLGMLIDADGRVQVRYRRIEGPGFNPISGEQHIEKCRLLDDWLEPVILDAPAPDHPNIIERDAPYRVARYIPVRKIERYETQSQIEERS